MMIRAIRLLAAALHVAVLLAACGAYGAYPYDSACRVTVEKNARRQVGGSGVLIAVNDSQALVLTVKHVALSVGLPATCDWHGQIRRGRVLAVSPSADVALLIVARPSAIRAVPVALPMPDSGPFVLAGYPGYDRRTLRYQTGTFVELGSGTLVVTCRPERGMSGGPAFDRYGRVVGTVSAFSPHYGFCGSGDAMIDLVNVYIR